MKEKGGASNSGVSDHASVSDSRVDTPGQAVEKPSSSSPSSFSGKAKEDKGDVNKDSLEVQIEKKTSCLPHQGSCFSVKTTVYLSKTKKLYTGILLLL